ncbi:unnamed protein product [Cyprideis torosa]|uniref:Uncharacterized protein n=1 Tax=Cyprideis torosa TaxID=163714 RepID=A0A7R8ZMN3_9CRUS|nr:unnamed protein product [Cyprideis torosa]CAG0895947.1 unnamed protein product [Cyprideis torosa]
MAVDLSDIRHLVDVDWSVGVTTSSSSAHRVLRPFVKLRLTLERRDPPSTSDEFSVMTWPEVIGCFLIVFSCPVVLFVLIVVRDAVHIVIFILSAFTWLVAFTVSALLWLLLDYLGVHIALSVVLAVFVQECFRGVLFLVLQRSRSLLSVLGQAEGVLRQPLYQATVCGLGIGTFTASFAISNMLRHLAGPGSVGISGDPEFLPLVASALTLAFFLHHIAWTVITFHGYAGASRFVLPIAVGLTHLGCTALTLINRRYQSTFFIVSIGGNWFILFCEALLALMISEVQLSKVCPAILDTLRLSGPAIRQPVVPRRSFTDARIKDNLSQASIRADEYPRRAGQDEYNRRLREGRRQACALVNAIQKFGPLPPPA